MMKKRDKSLITDDYFAAGGAEEDAGGQRRGSTALQVKRQQHLLSPLSVISPERRRGEDLLVAENVSFCLVAAESSSFSRFHIRIFSVAHLPQS